MFARQTGQMVNREAHGRHTTACEHGSNCIFRRRDIFYIKVDPLGDFVGLNFVLLQ